VADGIGDAKVAANWVMGPVQALMNERKEDAASFAVSAERLIELLSLLDEGVVSDGAAKKVLGFLAGEGGSAREIVEREGLVQVRDSAQLDRWVAEVVAGHPDEVARYRGGEKKLLGFLMGRVMGASKGQADPRQVNELLRSALEG
jgi:aspartyl-tRNA(Asn)/glutamyl-tRNA(Gln) amidotransferase subunit B